MFTGIIQGVGEITHWDGQRLAVAPMGLDTEGLEIGESVAVNGCCLTVVPSEDGNLLFDLSPETVLKTTFGDRSVGDKVNLERAMRPMDRFGGHIVQGHVDETGEVIGIREEGNATILSFRTQTGTFLIEKGSVAIDGVSLTVVSLKDADFDVWIIPHTIAHTNLGSLKVTTRVNVEFDQIAKYVQKLREPYRSV